MSNRIVHVIHSSCDVYVEAMGKDHVRIRITEKNSELLNPTDFEIEGIPEHIADALSNALFVLINADAFGQKGIS
jgi:hypothetical protein